MTTGATLAVIWISGVASGTVRALRTLMALGPRQDDAAAQLAFQLAVRGVIFNVLFVLFLLP